MNSTNGLTLWNIGFALHGRSRGKKQRRGEVLGRGKIRTLPRRNDM